MTEIDDVEEKGKGMQDIFLPAKSAGNPTLKRKVKGGGGGTDGCGGGGGIRGRVGGRRVTFGGVAGGEGNSRLRSRCCGIQRTVNVLPKADFAALRGQRARLPKGDGRTRRGTFLSHES